MPKGAFYVFANITGTGWKSKALADALLEKPASPRFRARRSAYGEGYLRFSVANSMENLMEALSASTLGHL
jgi:aspartate aminotransferase